MIVLKWIPNWKQCYKFYTMWIGFAAVIFNLLVANWDLIQQFWPQLQPLIPPDKLPYFNAAFAVIAMIVRNVHQPAVITTTPSPEKAP